MFFLQFDLCCFFRNNGDIAFSNISYETERSQLLTCIFNRKCSEFFTYGRLLKIKGVDDKGKHLLNFKVYL